MKAFPTPFGVNNGAVMTTDDYDMIVRCQVIDALTTNQGERVMFPDWGCNIQSVLFNPSDALERADAAAYLKTRLQSLVPRSFIKSVQVDVFDNEQNVVYIKIQYKASRYAQLTDLNVQMAIKRELS